MWHWLKREDIWHPSCSPILWNKIQPCPREDQPWRGSIPYHPLPSEWQLDNCWDSLVFNDLVCNDANSPNIGLVMMSHMLLQLTILYEEVLYTILHCLGKPDSRHVADPDELHAYIQKVRPQDQIHQFHAPPKVQHPSFSYPLPPRRNGCLRFLNSFQMASWCYLLLSAIQICDMMSSSLPHPVLLLEDNSKSRN